MRRFFRFGLGTLFVVLTITCVFLGTVVRRVIPQQRAVAAIIKAGGRVSYDNYDSTWLRSKVAAILGNDWCYPVRGVSLDGESCNEATLVNLRELPDVSSLILSPDRKTVGEPPIVISDDGMRIVASLPNLERVLLSGRCVSDVGMGYLRKHPRIKEVQVNGP